MISAVWGNISGPLISQWGKWENLAFPIPTLPLFHFFFQAGRIRAVGIVGIERKLEEKRKETDKNISEVGTFEVSRSTTCLNYLHSFTLSFSDSWDYLLFSLRSLKWLRVYSLQSFILFNWLINIGKGTSFRQFLSRRWFFETDSVYLLN